MSLTHSHANQTALTNTAELIIRTTPEHPEAGEPVNLEMMLHDSQGGMLKEFEPVHEELAHLIIIREGLDEFAHVHPLVDAGGNIRITNTFPLAGNYLMFVDFKPAGKPPATSKASITIAGEVGSSAKLVPDVPGLLQGDGLQANVSMRDSSDGQVVSFQLQDDHVPVTELEPYLGAMGHLVVISATGTEYVHAHPLTETANDGSVSFEVHFPVPGIYKMWGQFQRGGKVYTIPAVVNYQLATAIHLDKQQHVHS